MCNTSFYLVFDMIQEGFTMKMRIFPACAADKGGFISTGTAVCGGE